VKGLDEEKKQADISSFSTGIVPAGRDARIRFAVKRAGSPSAFIEQVNPGDLFCPLGLKTLFIF